MVLSFFDDVNRKKGETATIIGLETNDTAIKFYSLKPFSGLWTSWCSGNKAPLSF